MRSNSIRGISMISRLATAVLLVLSAGGIDGQSVCTKAKYLGLNKGFVHTANTKPGVESSGDTWSWRAKVMDEFKNEVGSLIGYCVRVPGGYWNCQETIMLADGHLYVQYVHELDKASSVGGVIGGTYKYMEARGQVEITEPAKESDPWELAVELCLPVDNKWGEL